MLRHGLADDSSIVGGYHTVTIDILELSHTGEGCLTVWCLVVGTTSITGCCIVGHTSLQCPNTVNYIEIVNCIDACALETLDHTYRIIDTDDVVVIRLTHGRTPVGVGIGQHIIIQLVDVVLIIIIGGIETQVEVLSTDDLIEQSQFNTLI